MLFAFPAAAVRKKNRSVIDDLLYYRKENQDALFDASVSGQWAVTPICPFQTGINVLIASNCFLSRLVNSIVNFVQGHERMLTDSSRSA